MEATKTELTAVAMEQRAADSVRESSESDGWAKNMRRRQHTEPHKHINSEESWD